MEAFNSLLAVDYHVLSHIMIKIYSFSLAVTAERSDKRSQLKLVKFSYYKSK